VSFTNFSHWGKSEMQIKSNLVISVAVRRDGPHSPAYPIKSPYYHTAIPNLLQTSQECDELSEYYLSRAFT